MKQTATKWLMEPTSILPLVAFRIMFGVLMLISTLRFMANGWIAEFYIQPRFHFTYYGFSWIKPLPGDGMYVVFILMAALAVLIALGCAYRVSMIVFFLLFTYVELLDKAYYLNHYYFISLLSFLLIFLPLHRYGSVDSWLRPSIKTAVVPRWTITAIQVQLGMVYFFAGVAKLQPDWLIHAQPMSIWLAANTGFPVLGKYFDYAWFAFLMSWAGALYDLSIGFFLSWRHTRLIAYLTVIAFHLMTAMLFQIGMFPWIMIICTLIFFPAESYPRWAQGNPTPSPLMREGMHGRRLAMLVLIPFFLFQLLMPFRHLLYPGNVLWTEEGYRFSWRVMLVEKAAYATFEVVDPQTGKDWRVHAERYLTPQQQQQMSFQPDMLLQFAHFLAQEYAQKGYPDVEVHSETYVSLNGQSSRLLIDPDVDLAAQPEGLLSKVWIRRY